MKVAVFNKKVLAIIALVVLILVTGIINYSLAKNKDADPNDSGANKGEPVINSESQALPVSQSASTRLIQYEAERKIERQKEMQYLNEIITDEKTDEDTRTLANQQKIKLATAIGYEKTIAELLVGKGFSGVTVVCGENTINVLINQTDATDPQIAQVLDVVIRETGTQPENIKIIPVD